MRELKGSERMVLGNRQCHCRGSQTDKRRMEDRKRWRMLRFCIYNLVTRQADILFGVRSNSRASKLIAMSRSCWKNWFPLAFGHLCCWLCKEKRIVASSIQLKKEGKYWWLYEVHGCKCLHSTDHWLLVSGAKCHRPGSSKATALHTTGIWLGLLLMRFEQAAASSGAGVLLFQLAFIVSSSSAFFFFFFSFVPKEQLYWIRWSVELFPTK